MNNKIDVKALQSGIIIQRISRKLHTRYVFTDREGKQFYVQVEPEKKFIYTSFMTKQMEILGFEPIPEDTKRHNGRFLFRITMESIPKPNQFVLYEDIVMLALLSANPKTYTYKEKACESIVHEISIIQDTDNEETITNSIRIIKECLKGIEMGWEIYAGS